MSHFFGLKDTFSYGKQPNYYDFLKFLAIFTMIIDHIGMYFMKDAEEFRVIGRIAYPLFLFLIGYSDNFRTSYILLFWGIVIEIVEHLYIDSDHNFRVNILIAIFLTRLLFKYLKKIGWLEKRKFFEIFFISALFYLPTSLFIEYGTLSILFAYAGWLLKNNKKTDKEYNLFLITTLAINFLAQKITPFSDYSMNFTMGFIGISMILYVLLIDMKNKVLSLNLPTAINTAFLFIARNSLIVYYTHVIIFIITSNTLT